MSEVFGDGPSSAATLTFGAPAGEWLEALPLGNGRLGAMVFGHPWAERIALNESTFWSGSPASESRSAVDSRSARSALLEARQAVLDERLADATAAVQVLQGDYSQAFLPLGDLRIELALADGRRPVPACYVRELDLQRGVHRVSYRMPNGSRMQWEAFVSSPDGVLCVQVRSEEPVRISVALSSTLASAQPDRRGGEAVLRVRAPGDVPPPHEPELDVAKSGNALSAAIVAQWEHDGVELATDRAEELAATDLRTLTLTIAAQTTFDGFANPPLPEPAGVQVAEGNARRRVRAAVLDGVDEVRHRHETDHRSLFDRVALSLDADDPVDEVLFHYGRYLLIAASRADGAPATLQGLWNEQLRPPWSSNYTININTQMNYWAAGPAALLPTVEPLVQLIESLARKGSETAARLYDAPGWVAHHNTDIWAYSSPVGRGVASPAWSFWPMGGAWLALSWADLLRFDSDEAAVSRAFPVLRGAMEFLLHWIVEIDGRVGTIPSTSPENTFRTDDGVFALHHSSTMDLAITAELAAAIIEIAERLGIVGDDVVERSRRLLGRLPHPSLGRGGTVPEWASDPLPAEPRHRHISHLFGLFPGTTLRGEELRAAAARTLDARGDESTGWSLVWKIAARARLRDARSVDRLLRLMFRPAPAEKHGERGGLYPNLFSAHPPFQIDGNLGYVAAVCECLLQSHDAVIDLLPALPTRWSSGSVEGLVARPGVRVDITWREGRLTEATLTPLGARARRSFAVRSGDHVIRADLARGPVRLEPHHFPRETHS